MKCRHPTELRGHFKIHTNEKTVKCTHASCNQTFTEKKFMLSHWRDAHLNKRKRSCLMCGRTFASPATLQVGWYWTKLSKVFYSDTQHIMESQGKSIANESGLQSPPSVCLHRKNKCLKINAKKHLMCLFCFWNPHFCVFQTHVAVFLIIFSVLFKHLRHLT